MDGLVAATQKQISGYGVGSNLISEGYSNADVANSGLQGIMITILGNAIKSYFSSSLVAKVIPPASAGYTLGTIYNDYKKAYGDHTGKVRQLIIVEPNEEN